jgi:hypothetical protein
MSFLSTNWNQRAAGPYKYILATFTHKMELMEYISKYDSRWERHNLGFLSSKLGKGILGRLP